MEKRSLVNEEAVRTEDSGCVSDSSTSSKKRSQPQGTEGAKKQKVAESYEVPDVDEDFEETERTLSRNSNTSDADVSVRRQNEGPDVPTETTDEFDFWGRHVPSHILLSIFKMIVDSDGALPFLCRVARVNRLWNDMSKQSILWRKVDLSFGWITQEERVLEEIVKSKNLSQLREVNLAGWKNLTNSGVQLLAENCPKLRSVKLSGTRVDSTGVTYLVDNCPDLNSFDLSALKTDAPHGTALHHLLQSRGNKVSSLNMSDNAVKNFNLTMDLITSTCCHLKVLDLRNIQFLSEVVMLDIEKLQSMCGELEVLRLGNTAFQLSVPDQVNCVGFLKLRELDLGIGDADQQSGWECSNGLLLRILRRSCHLKSLDLRGSRKITPDCLRGLAVPDLRELLISRSTLANYTGIEVVVKKWHHSLVHLDISWNIYPAMSLELAMKNSACDPVQSKLENLDLRGTEVTCPRVKMILEGCPRLNCLHLELRGGIPRVMKKKHAGTDLSRLRHDIASFAAKNDEAATTRDLCRRARGMCP